MSRLKQLFIASTGCVILAAMPAGLNADALSAGARLASDQEFVAVKHAPQPVSVRNANDFESTWPPRGTVHALFDLDRPETGPLPDGYLHRRRSLTQHRTQGEPSSDCAVRVSDCEDLDVINNLASRTGVEPVSSP
jgi:hypothetical protein